MEVLAWKLITRGEFHFDEILIATNFGIASFTLGRGPSGHRKILKSSFEERSNYLFGNAFNKVTDHPWYKKMLYKSRKPENCASMMHIEASTLDEILKDQGIDDLAHPKEENIINNLNGKISGQRYKDILEHAAKEEAKLKAEQRKVYDNAMTTNDPQWGIF